MRTFLEGGFAVTNPLLGRHLSKTPRACSKSVQPRVKGVCCSHYFTFKASIYYDSRGTLGFKQFLIPAKPFLAIPLQSTVESQSV